MKYLQFTKQFAGILVAAMLFTSCDKVKEGEEVQDKGPDWIKISGYGGIDANYGSAALVFDPTSTSETVEFQSEYIGKKVFEQDVTVTIGVDESKIDDINSTLSNPLDQYSILPTTMYNLGTTTAVIKAGQVFSDYFDITFNPSLFDPAVNYMLPITITSVTGAPAGVTGASKSGTAYFHIIGNPLAGTYHAVGYVYHPSVPRDVDEIKDLLPLTSATLEVPLGDLGGSGYYAAFTTDLTTNKVTITAAPGAAGAPYTQFDSGLPSTFPGYTPAWPGSAECNNIYDPATKSFKVRYGYLNAASGWRVSEEILTKQ